MSKDKIEKALERTKAELTTWHSTTTRDTEKKYSVEHAKWTAEKAAKNRLIRVKKQDQIQRKRKFVYWTDLGMNVGSELCEKHFCVVIKEFEKTAIVVPLSSVKKGDESSPWKTEENGYFKIGSLEDLPEKRESYAVISQIKNVSKKRLTSFIHPELKKRINMRLTEKQMDIIDEAIKNMLVVK